MATQGPGTVAQSGNQMMRLETDGVSMSGNIGFPRPSQIGAESNEELTTLGGLIDVRPKKLHMLQSLEARKSLGAAKAKDNLQTVLGTEKIMIQSKPRGVEQAQIHGGKMQTSRSRSKQNQMLSTQAKNEGAGSDGDLASQGNREQNPHQRSKDMNSMDREARQVQVPAELPGYEGAFDHDSSFNVNKSSKMTN